MNSEIAVVDYGMGNLRSVSKALEHLGLAHVVTSDARMIAEALGVILPGVGAFGDAMREMRSRGVEEVVRERAAEAAEGGRPFLGICLGMQVLVDSGEEDPDVPGLGVIPGFCPRIRRTGLKIPHMGWNSLKVLRGGNPLFTDLGESPYVYFVHSYEVLPNDKGVIAATTEYGSDIPASLWKNNLFATQFHPEKSQRTGLKMLENFGRVVSHYSESVRK